MIHRKADKMLIYYLSRNLKEKEKAEIESHILKCEKCQDEISTLKEIIEAIKRTPSISIEEKTFQKTKNLVYKALSEKGSQERFSIIIVSFLILSFIAFTLTNFLFYNIFLKIFREFTPLVFYTFLGYQFIGIVFYLIPLISKLKGGLENGKVF